VASGTATVLAAIVGNPFVVVYQVSALTFALAKRLVRYPGEFPDMADSAGNLPVAMPNLIAGRRIVPELLQNHFTAQNVAAELAPLLADSPERHAQIVALAELRHSLLAPRGLQLAPLDTLLAPLDRAADIIVDLLNRPAAPVLS
jgi:lipid-A-disaccharide synthase